MKSIATAVSTINVPFHGAELYVVNHNGEPYTPMKPIVEGMGLDWKSQHKKISTISRMVWWKSPYLLPVGCKP